jgi:CRISPR-associated endoribonuclease Cas6
MESIDPAVAESLHGFNTNPYRQYCVESDSGSGAVDWVITTFDDQTRRGLIEPMLGSAVDQVTLKSFDHAVYPILERTLTLRPLAEVAKTFYADPPARSTIEFLTPTAFRSAGKYVFHPDVRLLFQSLSTRYSALTEGDREPDEDLLTELASHTEIAAYNLRSYFFPLEASKIPAFTGSITLRHSGPATLRAYANLLLDVANHVGVGIKTAMGMGAVRVTHPPAPASRAPATGEETQA